MFRCKSVDDSLHTAHFEPLTPTKQRRNKMFGSFERGLDKMKMILTPGRKRLGSDAGPRKIKVVKITRWLYFRVNTIVFNANLEFVFYNGLYSPII